MSTRRPATVQAVLLPVALVAWYFQDLPGARELATGVGALAVAMLALAPRERVLGARIPWALLVFVVWACASFVWTFDRGGTVRALIDLVALVGVGMAAGVSMTVPELHRATLRAVRVVVAATVVALAVAPAWSTAPAEDGAPGWHGPFSHKNDLGAFCAVAVVTIWFGPRRARLGWLLPCLVLLAGSQSSTALALILLAAAVVVWQRVYGGLHAAGSRALLGVVTLVGVLALVVAVLTRFDVFALALGRSGSLTGRTEIWAAVWRQVAERPLLGHGWGGVWREWSAPTQEIWREARFPAYYAHNGYLDVALQVGVVGLVLFLFVLAPTLRRLWTAREDGPAFWGVLLVLTSLLAATTESAPFTGRGLLLLAALAVAVASQGGGGDAAQDRAAVPDAATGEPRPRPAVPASTGVSRSSG